jgi:hypothetical protein
LAGYSKQLSQKTNAEGKLSLSFEDAAKFMEFYGANLARLDKKKFDIEQILEGLVDVGNNLIHFRTEK